MIKQWMSDKIITFMLFVFVVCERWADGPDFEAQALIRKAEEKNERKIRFRNWRTK